MTARNASNDEPRVARTTDSLPAPTSAQMAAIALLITSAGATAIWTTYAKRPYPAPLLILVVLSFGPLGLVVAFRTLRSALRPRTVAVVIGALLAFAVVVPRPAHGSDLYAYAVYGRIIVDHGQSPYVHPPSDYPNDPWVRELQLYRGDKAFYGPLFIGMTGAIAAVGGDSRLVVRLAYQLGAALAVALSLLLLARAGAPLFALALVGLNPVLIVEVVSQGRMDAYVGLGLLAGAILAGRRRPHLAALAIAAAALVKIPAGLALVALVAWVWRTHGARKAAAVAATGIGVVALCYLAAGGFDALRPLLQHSGANNDISLWVPFRNFPHGLARATGDTRAVLGPIGPIPTFASLTAIILGALFVAPHLEDRRPVLVLLLPVLAYLLTSPYPTSWYLGWILPLLALQLRSRAAVISLSLFSLLMVRQFYSTAAHLARGAQSLTDYAKPVMSPVLRALHTGATSTEVFGIVVLAVEAARALRGARSGRGGLRPSQAPELPMR